MKRSMQHINMQLIKKNSKKIIKNIPWKTLILVGCAFFLILSGSALIWVSTFKIPDLDALRAKALSQSTKIYDKTGEILLYDLNPNLKRTVVPFDKISQHAKDATLAIEDDSFYSHIGVRPLSFLRSLWVNLWAGYYAQGGSTITQQVIKLSLLSTEKTLPRKIKEWVLAIRLEQIADKDTILALYLNSIPYGGNLYGIQEASLAFFAKNASDLTITEAAYLAALPQAPTRYSPFGPNRDTLLENRKNLVLQKMLENEFITLEEYTSARNEKVVFQSGLNQSIKAPHFVMYIRQYLEEKYGEDVVENGGLKVITTLDYTMQSIAERVAKEYALKNAENFNATNAAVVIIDPKTGGILSMVGSRDYFDKNIDGNFNVALSQNRQPGSTYKPFIYAAGFNKGYTPETILFDVPTQFSLACKPEDTASTSAPCYAPTNYDDRFRGPMTIRNALSGSINIPAVKMLYLVGLADAIKISKDMGITTITDPNKYGLTLVLGGGSVSLLEMTSAYSVFANTGVRNPYNSILSIQDAFGETLESFEPKPQSVLPEQTALQINDILSDSEARAREFGAVSPMNIPGYDVAVKTGTTNDYVDTWIIGYTPNIAVGAWAGNNNNTPIERRVAGYVVAPLWRAIMDEILPLLPKETFTPPIPTSTELKPVLRGIWQGGNAVTFDKKTGTFATETTPLEDQYIVTIPDVHDILHWVNKNDPQGPAPTNPSQDAQYEYWEYGVQKWLQSNPLLFDGLQPATPNETIPTN